MKKNISFYKVTCFIVLTISFLGCKKDNLFTETNTDIGMLSLSLSNPADSETGTRIGVAENTINNRLLVYKWTPGEKIHLCFVQENRKAIAFTTVQSISPDGKKATLAPVAVPDVIQTGDFTLIGSNDLQESGSGFDANTPTNISLPSSDWYWTSLQQISDNGMRFYFKSKITAYQKGSPLNVNENFKPLGYFLCIKLKNISTTSITVNKLKLQEADNGMWVGNSSTSADGDHAVFDVLNEQYVKKGADSKRVYNVEKNLAKDEVVQIDAWSIPLDQIAYLKLNMFYNGNNDAPAYTKDVKKIPVLDVNKRYFLYAVWDGVSLSYTDKNFAATFEFMYENHKYVIVKDKKTWTDAAADALARGGHLVHINSAAEQLQIQTCISVAGIPLDYATVDDGGDVSYLWIGATDKNEEGKWIWDGTNSGGGVNFWNGQGAIGATGGTAINGAYVNWGKSTAGVFNEPDNFNGNQNAAGIAQEGWPKGGYSEDGELIYFGQTGEWNDININNKLYYIVEIE